MRVKSAVLGLWLTALTAGHVAALARLWEYFVCTKDGQRFDTIALASRFIGQNRINHLVDTVLNAMSVLSLAVAMIMIGFIALARGRRGLALMTVLLVVGANVTTQLVKQYGERPNLGVDPERAAAGNSLPSGHTTIAASVAIALVLVLPPRLRATGALIGAGYTALAGVATLSAGWHRPSDAVAALLIVGAWAAAVGVVLLLLQRREDLPEPDEAHPVAVATLALAGTMLLGVAVIALDLTNDVLSIPPAELSRRRLLAAYAGSVGGIAGAAATMMALVLATVHHVVPHRGEPSRPTAATPPPATNRPPPESMSERACEPVPEPPPESMSGPEVDPGATKASDPAETS